MRLASEPSGATIAEVRAATGMRASSSVELDRPPRAGRLSPQAQERAGWQEPSRRGERNSRPARRLTSRPRPRRTRVITWGGQDEDRGLKVLGGRRRSSNLLGRDARRRRPPGADRRGRTLVDERQPILLCEPTRVRMSSMDASPIEGRLDAIAPLAEPVRRSLYLYVVGRPDAVGRDEAASAVGIGRPLAAFHLDRLVEAGLLRAEYRRLSGRTGPGAGRPAKLYRRAGSAARGQPPGAPRRRGRSAVRRGARGGAARNGLGHGHARTRRERLWGLARPRGSRAGRVAAVTGQAGRSRPRGPGRSRVRAVRAGRAGWSSCATARSIGSRRTIATSSAG